MTPEKRVFSGLRPTGNLHLGNDLGAIVNFGELPREAPCLFRVVGGGELSEAGQVVGAGSD